MKLLIDRKWKKSEYTVGKLFINGAFFCNTLEDKDRGLSDTMSESAIRFRKVYSRTAIPTGSYEVRMDTVSPSYSMKPWYVSNCNGGRMPRLEGVKCFSGILIHPGTTAADSCGCILVGKNTAVGKVTQSKETFLKLYGILHEAHKRGERITIEIQ